MAKLPKSLIKKYGISKKAWAVFKARKKGKSRSRASSPKRKTTKRRTTMARRKRRGRSRGITIPLAPIAGLAGLLAVPAARAVAGDWPGAIHELRNTGTGFDENGQFHFDWLMKGWGPVVVGLLVHKFIGGPPLNLNRMLANANVPFIRV